MQFYLINIRPKLHRQKWRKLHVCVTLLVNMSTVLSFLNFTINAALRPTIIWKLCYWLSSVVTFTFLQIFDQNFVFFCERRQSCCVYLIQCQNWRNFWCPVWKMKNWLKKCKYTWKLKHTNSLRDTFEYFYQILSKLIHIILSYTVSKLVHFLRQCNSICLYWSYYFHWVRFDCTTDCQRSFRINEFKMPKSRHVTAVCKSS